MAEPQLLRHTCRHCGSIFLARTFDNPLLPLCPACFAPALKSPSVEPTPRKKPKHRKR